MTPAQTWGTAGVAAALLAVSIALASLVQVFRYEYSLQTGRTPHYFVRVDRLTGEACYMPVSYPGEQVAPQVLTIEECGGR